MKHRNRHQTLSGIETCPGMFALITNTYRNRHQTLSGIETIDNHRGDTPLAIEIDIKPFQGLKHLTSDICQHLYTVDYHRNRHQTLSGIETTRLLVLKQQREALDRNRHQTLSGIETSLARCRLFTGDNRNRHQTLSGIETRVGILARMWGIEIDIKPFQGLKQGSEYWCGRGDG